MPRDRAAAASVCGEGVLVVEEVALQERRRPRSECTFDKDNEKEEEEGGATSALTALPLASRAAGARATAVEPPQQP